MFSKKARQELIRRVSRSTVTILIATFFSFGLPVGVQTANAVLATPSPVCSAGTCTVTFPYSSADYYAWTIPAGLTSVTFDVQGSKGGGASGGLGGRVQGTLAVGSFSTLYIYIGSNTGVNGGGAPSTGLAGNSGGYGGGASDIRTSASGSTYSNRLVVAGGGGGQGAYGTGGAGGGTTGGSGSGNRGAAATGGTQSAGGTGGAGNYSPYTGKGGNGSLGVGGNGGYCGGAGGGGGGYYGGGGGATDNPGYCDNDDASGAGGSSFADANYATSVTHTQSYNSSNGQVIITYVTSLTVTFDSNTATSGAASVASVTQATTGAAVTLATQNTLLRTGYTFSGWNTAADGSGTTLTAGSSYTPASSLTLYVQWNSTISYDTNTATSGTAPPATTAKSSAAVTSLSSNTGTLAKTGYTFGGWNTASNGSGSSYQAGTTTYASSGSTTLYAQWNSVITYMANGSTTGSAPAASNLYGTTGTLAGNTGTLTKTNYTLTGWNTNETGTGTSYALSGSYTPNGNVTLYAEWSSVITYNGNVNTGGSAPANTTIKGLSGTLATNSGSLVNGSKVFAGWNTNSSGTGTWYASGGTYANLGNLTLYAQWVSTLSLTGPSTLNINQGTAFRSDTYTATAGLDTKTVTYQLSASNAGITLETATVSGTTYAYIRTTSTVYTGTYIDTLTATDRMGTSVSLAVTLTISTALNWAAGTPTSITATFGTAKSVQISTTDGFANKSYTLTQGLKSSLGITLDTSTASSGTVTLNISNRVVAGTYYETITATDVTGRKVAIMITVNVAPPIGIIRNGVKYAEGYSSLQFNGTSQYLTLPASSKYQLNSTWTVEWWQYETDTSTNPTVFGFGAGWNVGFGSSGTKLAVNGSDIGITLTPANYKNKWTHFAIVNNAGFAYVYVDGVAMNSTALTTVANLTSSAAPATSVVCVAVRCTSTTGTTFLASSYFGGYLTNISISKKVLYSGTLTSTANFTPSSTMDVDSQTVIALQGLYAGSNLIDYGTGLDTVTAYNSPVGSFSYPNVTASFPIVIETTEKIAQYFYSVQGTGGVGDIIFSSTPVTTGVRFSRNFSYGSFNLTDSVTAINATTARIATETMTGTDGNGSQISINYLVKINPPLSFVATSLNPTIPALVNYYDTITAVYGTGNIVATRSGSQSSGIFLSAPSETQTVINIRPSTPVGTYYETITVYDSAGDSETVVIVMTVTPGLTLSATDSATSLSATSGKMNSLQINAINGSGSKTFTLTHLGTASSYITLDTSTAGSNYATLKVGNGGTVPAGTYSEQITVVDGQGSSVSLTISVTVNAAPTISYGGATSGAITLTTTTGAALTSNAFTAGLGTGSRTLSLSGLNSGITIDTSTANTAYVTAGSSLAANGATAKSYYETMTVTDSLTATSIRAFTVVVNPAISLAASSATLTTTAGVSITDTITATLGTGNKTFALTSSPSIAGITNTTNVSNQTTLTIPNTVGAGTYIITVTATDSVGATSSINVTLNVNGGVVISGNVAIAMTTGYAFNSSSYSASGGTGSYTYLLTGTLSSSYISLETLTATSFRLKMTSATPSGSGVAATYNETVTVTDAAGGKGYFNLTLTVNPVIALTSTQTINTTYGTPISTVYQTSGGTAPFYIQGSSLCAPVKSIDGNYTVLSFVATGTCAWVAPAGVSSVTALVVGGGASGDRGYCSYWYGNGGGGGQVKELSTSVTSGSSYNVIVGAGGIKTTNCPYGGAFGGNGRNGESSSFGSITSNGGIAATVTTPTGGSSYAPDGTVLTGGTHASAYPNANYVTAGYPSGGGAGSGGAGSGMNGGPGVTSTITGLMYGSGGPGFRWDATGQVLVSGTYYSGAQPAQTVPLPNRGAGGSDWTDGASGIVVLKYLTPTVVDRTRFDIYTDTNTATSAKIVFSIPDSVTVGTYTQTLVIKDSANASTTYTISIVVAKATPTVSISIPGGGSAATYGSPVSLTANSSTSGTATFKNGASNISSCVGTATSGGSASCNWTPTDTSTVTMTAAFVPADTTNYNSVTSSNFVLSVNQADTLTVTFNNQTLTYSESGTAVSRAFTLAGLASIDTVTAVATAITGTANDSSAVNVTGSATNGSPGTSTVTKAGTFSLSGTGITFSGNTKASYYKAIAYSPGTITVNRASNPMSVNYGTANTITYKPTGTETATVTYKGTGTKSFSTSDSTYCTVDSSNGAVTTVQAGSCDVSFSVADSPNFLGDTITATVRINKATRTVTAAVASTSLKYGETTTVSGSISADTSTALMSISTLGTTGCTVDPLTGVLTAVSGTATCSFAFVAAESNNYLQATSNTVNVALSKANAPVLTLTAPENVNYSSSATSASMPRPTFSITGLKLTDTLTAISGITISYVATGTYSYNSTTVPTGANVYTLTPTAITLSIGSMSNYNTPTYSGVNWTINQISQDSLTIVSLFQEGITVPYDLQYSGGSTNGTVTGQIVPGGTASSCSFSGINLRANGTGTCFIRIQMAGNQNYLVVTSDTYTVLIANFKQATLNFDSLAQGAGGITITSQVPISKGPDVCTTNCQPTITGVSPMSAFLGDPITITGTNFDGATEVIFNRNVVVTDFQVDNGGTTITVIVPISLTPGDGTGSISVRSPGGLSFRFSGITFKASNVVG